MIKSPLIQELRAEALHGLILYVLKARFGPVPRDVSKLLRTVLNEKKLRKLNVVAATGPDLAAFCEALLT
jgi:hypothetical protein